jgi:hypothetical protein
MKPGIVCQIAKSVCLIVSALSAAFYAFDWYETGRFNFVLVPQVVAVGLFVCAWTKRNEQPSVKSMLMGDLLALPMIALIAGMLFTFAVFVHSGGFAVCDVALGLFCAAAAVVVARRIMKRMLAGVENPSFRAAEQTMLGDIGELVNGLQAERAIPKAA